MRCTACAAAIDASSVFPGATLRCACGVDNVVPLPPRLREETAYRDAGSAQHVNSGQAAMISCPFCGGPCTSESRACPHCNVELAAVRCPECFALHFTGARFCSRCRAELHDGPLLLDASDSPCPRCDKPLRTTPEAGVFECTSCGGLFVDHTAFATLAAEKEHTALVFDGPPPPPSTRLSSTDAEVHYVKCPVCREVMNRINFGKRSGVIVDLCGLHGTWFDPGELTRVLEWIASGGHIDERTRERVPPSRTQIPAANAPMLPEHPGDTPQGIGLPSADVVLELLRSFFLDR